ncbi:hypothetical protein ABFS82_02G174700 [Erythranthe guttata]|uniref:RING-type domain-containing protein n=2 Tax=Erythranthe guttata TaxID=4155 RepID=A0A022QU74_ERYGU|nr:hypothetical protein MIMGU_mgv1a008365mg [Erythranthe guttata]
MGFLLRTIFFALFLFQTIQSQNDCRFQSCGENQFLVRFPFRLRGEKQPERCGYPGFDLICTTTTYNNKRNSQVPLLNLPYSGDFVIRDINYLTQEIQLYDPNNCLPKRLLNLNLSSSPFFSGYSENLTFLSCPPEQIANSRFAKIDCLSNSTSSVLATSSMNLVKALSDNCSTIAALSVPVLWPLQNSNDWLSSDLSGDLMLTWNVPNCEGCEARGGVCGFENGTSDRIMCYTDPRTVQSRGMKIFKIIALSIVIPAVTCSICISSLSCMFERRRDRDSATSAAVAPQSPAAGAPEGLDESTIQSYKKLVLGDSRRLPGPNGATCPICLVDYHPRDTLRCIPLCDHCFHSDCVDEWLRLNGTCPVCRNSPAPTPPE